MIVKSKDSTHYKELMKCETHTVLSVEFGSEDAFFRIHADRERGPALYPTSSCTIVCGRIPSQWEVIMNRGKLQIGPKEWYVIGFWEKYFDGESDAVAIFDQIAEKIILESELG